MNLYLRDASFWASSKPSGRGFTVYHVKGPHKNRIGGATAACDVRIMLLEDGDGGDLDVHEVPHGLRCSRPACKRRIDDFNIGEATLDAMAKR